MNSHRPASREKTIPRLIISTCAAGVPMGAEAYQEAVASRAQQALDAATPGESWAVERRVVRSLRSPLPGDHRLPMRWLRGASPEARRALGRLLYPRGAVVHRMNLELPPASHADVVTLHDVVSWKFPDESRPVRAAAEEIRRAAAVICVSAFTAYQATELFGLENPHVVHNGVDSRFFDAEPLTPAQLRQLGLGAPYVLAVGGATIRKNLDGLAQAWSRIHSARRDLELVLSGPEHPRRTALFQGQPGVHLIGRIPSKYVPGLVAAAAVVVVPSLHEGFGLPALEGMAAQTPVVAANTSALPEVVGDAGLLVDPSPDGIAQGVLHAASGHSSVADAVRQGRERAATFTWARSAAGHATVWSSVAP